jgi:hypothetical protein
MNLVWFPIGITAFYFVCKELDLQRLISMFLLRTQGVQSIIKTSRQLRHLAPFK